MTLTDLNQQRVGLIGFGVENRALLNYLVEQGARVTVCDQSTEIADLPEGIEARLGDDYLNNLTDFSIIFRSPGVPFLTREIQAARQSGVIISSQTKLFFELSPAKIIGVTGTKGKGTTTSLIHAMLVKANQKGELEGQAYLAGNIGLPPIDLLAKLTPQDWVVLELSSFQLQDLTSSPHIAVVLTVGLDHLDHHRDEAEYISAKKNIARYQTPSDCLIYHEDSLTSSLFTNESPARIRSFSRNHPVDDGAFVDQSRQPNQLICRTPGRDDLTICSVSEIQLVGDFNQENVLAASLASLEAGVPNLTVREAIKEFKGLAHRLQFVATKNKVSYYDNSYSTTPESAIASIKSFDQPITLIVGGSSKGANFEELVEAIVSSSVANVICIGQEGEQIYELLTDQGAKAKLWQGGQTMDEIVTLASKVSGPGDVVLLSPAAASFDMFKNYADRGDQFCRSVLQLMGDGE